MIMKTNPIFRTVLPYVPAFRSCDTLVATGQATQDGVTLFAKNSDREPNEAHVVVSLPAADYPPNSLVRCTYIEVPQVRHTFAVLLAKPFWIWGAEMGVNEHGLAIGNEAVFTKIAYQKKGGLTGMDLLRLGLERARTALEAVNVITDLLERFGQGGNCGFQHKFYYHNSFLMADPKEAWVLETAGPHWAAKKVEGVYTISNGLTITNNWDVASPDLVHYALDKGWCKDQKDFDFAHCYSDFLYTKFSDCRKRRNRTMELLTARQNAITIQTMAKVLRDHGEDADENWRPDVGLTGANICMHAGFGPIRGSQTTGSLICHLNPEHPTIFYTGTAAPCTSTFKPIWLDTPLPPMGGAPTGRFDDSTLFWRHEKLHRLLIEDYDYRVDLFREERDELENEFITKALYLADKDVDQRSDFVRKCYDKAANAEERWFELVASSGIKKRSNWLYALAWKKFNRKAGMRF